MARRPLLRTPLLVAISYVLYEADPLGLYVVKFGCPWSEYDYEANDIVKLLSGNNKVNAMAFSESLHRLFRDWGYSSLTFKNWQGIGEAVAWLVSNQGKWEAIR